MKGACGNDLAFHLFATRQCSWHCARLKAETLCNTTIWKENMSQTGLLFFIKSPHRSLPVIKVITAHFRKLENTEERGNKKLLVILASKPVAIDIAAFLSNGS